MSAMKIIGTMSLAALLALFFVGGCSPGRDPGVSEDGVVTVRFWHAMGGPLGAVMMGLIDEFNEAHPEIHIRAESMGTYEALRQRLLASWIAGNQPEMAQAYEGWIATLIGGEAVVDLAELDPGFAEELEDFFPVFIENSYYDGRLKSLPFNKSVPVIYYNRDMFRRAGLDPERPPRTWDEFLETSRILTRDFDGSGRPDQWGHKFSDHATYFNCLLVQNGGEIFDHERNMVVFDSPEGEEALGYLVDLVRKHRVADFYLGGYDHQVDFAAGRVGMIVASSVSRTFMIHQIGFDWGMAPLLENKQPGNLVYGTNTVILSRASPAQKQAAWEFIKWFTSPEITARWSLATGYVPVRESALELEIMREEFARNPDSRVPIDMLEHAFFEPRQSLWLLAREFLGDAVKEALLGSMSPGEALRAAADKSNFWLR